MGIRALSRSAAKFGYWGLLLCTAAAVFLLFVRITLVGRHDPAFNEKMLTGTAYQPFVYRQLLPTLANLLSPLVSEPLALRIGRKLDLVWGQGAFLDLLSGTEYPCQVILIFGLMYLSLVGFSVVIWLLLRQLGYRTALYYLAPFVLLLGLRIFMEYGYFYDFTSLFMFSLGILLLSRAQWPGYLLVFAIGSLNKETTAILWVIFAVHFLVRLPRRTFCTLSALQFGTYAAIQAFLRFRYRDNPGTGTPWRLETHLAEFREIADATPWLLPTTGVILVVVAMMIAYGWSRKPALLRAALSAVPFFLFLFLYMGYYLEIRALLEVFPVIALMMIPPQALGTAPVSAAALSAPALTSAWQVALKDRAISWASHGPSRARKSIDLRTHR